MMFQNTNAQQDSAFSSKAMQRRMDTVLQNANTLFSLGWLRKRLWKELSSRVGEVPATEYGNYARVLQGSYESRFIWEFLSVCQKSVADVRRIIENAYETQDPLEELIEEREECIREFARMDLSRTWEWVKDDDQSWRNFARRLPLDDPGRRADIARFFEMLDRISVITDIVCHRAGEYGLNVDYSSMEGYDLEQRRKALTDEVLARAIDTVGYHLTTQSRWAVVYCVLRDDYHYENQSEFERNVVKLPNATKRKECPEGTVSRTMSNNNFMYAPVSKWAPDNKFTKFAADFRAAIKAELAK